MSGFSIFVLNLSKSDNISFRSMPNGNCPYSSASLSLAGDRDNSLEHELRVSTAVELHVNEAYYAQHPALKTVYGKSQSVIGGKLFSSYRASPGFFLFFYCTPGNFRQTKAPPVKIP